MTNKWLACLGILCTITPTVRAANPGDWAGPYVGGAVGISSAAFTGSVAFPSVITSSGTPLPGGAVSLDPGQHASAMGGAHAGYNWFVHGFVTGVEGQVTGTMSSGTVALGAATAAPFVPGDTFTATAPWTTTVRARLGLARSEWLFYGTAGVALTSVTLSGTFPTEDSSVPFVSGSDRHTLKGGTFGVGVERRVGKAQTVGAEYRHTRYASQAFHLSNVATEVSGTNVEPIIGTMGTSDNEVALRVTVPLRMK